jgi:hypothetical protein
LIIKTVIHVYTYRWGEEDNWTVMGCRYSFINEVFIHNDMLLPRILAYEFFSFGSSHYPNIPNVPIALIPYKFYVSFSVKQNVYLTAYQIFKYFFKPWVQRYRMLCEYIFTYYLKYLMVAMVATIVAPKINVKIMAPAVVTWITMLLKRKKWHVTICNTSSSYNGMS